MSRLEADTTRATFSISPDLLETFDGLCQDADRSRSDQLRELVAEFVADHTETDTDYPMPDDPRLARAYQQLWDAADRRFDTAKRLTFEEAKNELYTNTVPKDAVKRRFIIPLKQQGFIDVRPAMNEVWVYVRTPT